MDKMVPGGLESQDSNDGGDNGSSYDSSVSNGARLSLFGPEQGPKSRFEAGSAFNSTI
jgi:hypothetical protein